MTGGRIETGRRLVVHREPVLPEWIDYNGHMNVAYYVLACDHAVDAMFDFVGFDEAYRRRHGVSTFALETHVTYVRELRAGDPMRFELQVLDLDEKRLHHIYCLHHDEENWLAATAEWISLHVDMSRRRAAPFRPDVYERFQALHEAHRDIAPPPQTGHVIGIPRKRG